MHVLDHTDHTAGHTTVHATAHATDAGARRGRSPVDSLALLARSDIDDFTRAVRTRAALASLHRPTALLNASGTVLDVNEALVESLGTDRDSLASHGLADLAWWAGRPTARARISDLVERAASGDAGARVVAACRLDGQVVPVQIAVAPIKDATDQVVFLRAEVEQLTDARRTIGLLDQRNEAVAGAEARFRALADHSRDLVGRHRPDGTFIEVSSSAATLLGVAPGELVGTHPRSLTHPDDVSLLVELTSPADVDGVGARSIRLRRRDGEYVLMRVVVTPVANAAGEIVELVSIAHPGGREMLTGSAAFHDTLTGLPTRELFVDRLDQALASTRRTGQPVAVLSLDLSGHGVQGSPADWADATLVGIGRRLRALVRPGDTLARVGFDDFAMLCVGIDGPVGAQVVAYRLLNSLHEPFEIDGRSIQLRPSIGVVTSTGDDHPEELLDQADAARQAARSRPAPRVSTYDPVRHDTLPRRSESLERALRSAIADVTLAVHYQPELDLRTGTLAGFEALVRWPVADALLPPAEFIPMAEETGLIVDLGRLVIDTACRQARRWSELAGRPIPVWVNLSGRQLGHPDLVSDIVNATIDAGITTEMLAFEITESVLVEDTDAVIDQLSELRRRGYGLAIDDFGTG